MIANEKARKKTDPIRDSLIKNYRLTYGKTRHCPMFVCVFVPFVCFSKAQLMPVLVQIKIRKKYKKMVVVFSESLVVVLCPFWYFL